MYVQGIYERTKHTVSTVRYGRELRYAVQNRISKMEQ